MKVVSLPIGAQYTHTAANSYGAHIAYADGMARQNGTTLQAWVLAQNAAHFAAHEQKFPGHSGLPKYNCNQKHYSAAAQDYLLTLLPAGYKLISEQIVASEEWAVRTYTLYVVLEACATAVVQEIQPTVTDYTAQLIQYHGAYCNLTTEQDAFALQLGRTQRGHLTANLDAVAHALHADSPAQVETLASATGYVVYVLGYDGAYHAEEATALTNSVASYRVGQLVGNSCEITGPCLIIQA